MRIWGSESCRAQNGKEEENPAVEVVHSDTTYFQLYLKRDPSRIDRECYEDFTWTSKWKYKQTHLIFPHRLTTKPGLASFRSSDAVISSNAMSWVQTRRGREGFHQASDTPVADIVLKPAPLQLNSTGSERKERKIWSPTPNSCNGAVHAHLDNTSLIQTTTAMQNVLRGRNPERHRCNLRALSQHSITHVGTHSSSRMYNPLAHYIVIEFYSLSFGDEAFDSTSHLSWTPQAKPNPSPLTKAFPPLGDAHVGFSRLRIGSCEIRWGHNIL